MPRILLVDDDDAFRKMLRITLERMGHEVVQARNGVEALREYENRLPDLVLLDLIMPEKEGIETIMELKESHPEVKVIAMSGGGRINANDFLKIAQQLGARHTLAKPFTNQELAAAIANTLSEGKP